MIPRKTETLTTVNPWLNMPGLRRYIRLPGIPLPKHVLRPFSYQLGKRIDDNEYAVVSYSRWKGNLQPPYAIAYIVAIVFSITCIIAHCNIIELWLIPLSLLCLAGGLHRAYWRYENNLTCYSRRAGIVRYEYGVFKLNYCELPFQECEGRIVSTSNIFGFVQHRLILTHPIYSKNILLFSDRSIDEVLGYWSLIVKYMDGSEVLPDIWQLNSYPNREKGLGEYVHWLESLKNQEVNDPFLCWLDKLKLHPELDYANFGRNLSFSGLFEGWIRIRAFIVFSGLFLWAVIALTH
jgi:hypothetical protein